MENPGNTVPAVLYHWATHQPDTAAFVFVNSAMKRRVLTRANVYRLASRFSAILRRDDVKRGDIICNTLPNSPERLVSDMGIMLAGATAMNGQILLKDGEDFLGNLKDSRCTAVILDPLALSGAAIVLKPLQMEDGEDGKVRYKTLPALRRQYQCYWTSRGDQVSFMDMLEQEPDSYVADVTPDDMACIWTTSGSTGFSKLIPRTHDHILTIARQFASACGIYVYTSENATGDEVAYPGSSAETSPQTKHACNDNIQARPSLAGQGHKDLPSAIKYAQSQPIRYAKYVCFNNGRLGWVGGFPASYFIVGVTRVLLDLSTGSPDNLAEFCWTLICQERCEYASIVSSHIQQILSQPGLWSHSSWKCRIMSSGGQPVHKSVVKGCLEKMTDSLHIIYGSSELGFLSEKAVTDHDLYEDCNSGKPIYDVELKVVDDNMQEIPPGSNKSGEILAKTSTSLKYYVGNEELSKKTILADGWCRTGDVGYINDDGEVFVFCRKSFAIMHGAYIVYPGWLENRIKKHPAVRDAMVVPVPDQVVHQELCACVVFFPETEVTENELKQFCEDLFLTSREDEMTAVPRYFLFFSNFPTTATGKTCRRSTISEALARLAK